MPQESNKGMPSSPVREISAPIVAIAASAGGLRALGVVLAGLPRHFPAAVLIVQHLDPRYHPGLLADLLGGRTALAVKEAADGDRLRSGQAYIAPADRHLLVNSDNTLSLSCSELVHFLRPSADLLFESAAASHKERVVAVVLTGSGCDGAMGVKAVKKMGGSVIAQDESTSEFFGMPEAAIRTGYVDIILPLPEIAPALISLLSRESAHVGY